MPPTPDAPRSPDAPEPALQAAARLLAAGQPGEAADALGALLGTAPTYAAAHVLHATALDAAGHPGEALAAWDRAAFLMPRSPLVVRERERLRSAALLPTDAAPEPPADAGDALEEPAEPPPDDGRALEPDGQDVQPPSPAELPEADPAADSAEENGPPAADERADSEWAADEQAADEPEPSAAEDRQTAPDEAQPDEPDDGPDAWADDPHPRLESFTESAHEPARDPGALAPLPGAEGLDALDLHELLGLPPASDGPAAPLPDGLDEAPVWPRATAGPPGGDFDDGVPELDALPVDDLLDVDAAGGGESLPDWLAQFEDDFALEPGPAGPRAEEPPPPRAPAAVFADWGDARSPLLPPEASGGPAADDGRSRNADDADGWAVLAEDDAPLDADARPPAEPEPAPPVAPEPPGSGVVADELDALISSLSDAPRIRPDPAFSGPALSADVPDGGGLASETLAKIYAAQKQYAEAAAVYERLAARDPARADGFLERAAAMRAAAGGSGA